MRASLSHEELCSLIKSEFTSLRKALLVDLDKHFTVEEAARYLRMKKSYMYKLTKYHEVPFYKPHGKRIYLLKSELDKWVRNKRSASQEELERVSA